MQQKIVIIEEEEALRIKIVGEIDHHSSVAVRSQIDSRLYNVRPTVLILDFSSVNFMDSSGIGLIMGRVEKAKSIGTCVKLVGLSKTNYKLVKLSGLTKIDGLQIIEGRENK